MGTGSFPGVRRSGRGADHPPPSKCRGQERVGLYLYSYSGPSWPVMGAPLPLPLPLSNVRHPSTDFRKSQKGSTALREVLHRISPKLLKKHCEYGYKFIYALRYIMTVTEPIFVKLMLVLFVKNNYTGFQEYLRDELLADAG